MFFPKKRKILDKTKIPRHIAVIMDGNGRWAVQKGLPRIAGHRAGAEALRKTIRSCGEIGVKHLTVYAFSTENWERPKNEVDFLMSLFSETIDKELGGLKENKISIRFLGKINELPKELQNKMQSAMEETKHNSKFNLNVMVNYGGRAEIVDAVNKIINHGSQSDISEKTLSENLYTFGLPEPDLLIRTAYERRISNFMLWQIAYSELYFTKKLWPDFDKNELVNAIIDYQSRTRRFGKL